MESLKAWIEGDSENKGGEGNKDPSAYDVLMRGIGTSEWKKVESNMSLGYTVMGCPAGQKGGMQKLPRIERTKIKNSKVISVNIHSNE